MIGYVKGIVSHILADHCFIDVQGVGYRLFITEPTRRKLVVGTVGSLFTYLHVREDALLLYGFYTEDEYGLFLQLTSINGIGPKVALGVLSAVEPNQLRLAISQKNVSFLTKIPGIGKKTAERMILELKDKIGTNEQDAVAEDFDSNVQGSKSDDITGEAIQALLALGYTQAEVSPVIRKIGIKATTVEEVIKLVLRELSRG